MKKITTLLLFAFLALSAQAQNVPDLIRTTPIPASGANKNNRATVDANLKAALALNIPKGPSYTLNGAKDSIGYVFYNTTSSRFGIYQGSGVWLQFISFNELQANFVPYNNANKGVTLGAYGLTGAGLAAINPTNTGVGAGVFLQSSSPSTTFDWALLSLRPNRQFRFSKPQSNGGTIDTAIYHVDYNTRLFTFDGIPESITPLSTANNLQIPTTAWVRALIASGTAGVSSFNGRMGAVTPQIDDYSSFYAKLPGGNNFTGTQNVTVPMDAYGVQMFGAGGGLNIGTSGSTAINVSNGATNLQALNATAANFTGIVTVNQDFNLQSASRFSLRNSDNTSQYSIFNDAVTDNSSTSGLVFSEYPYGARGRITMIHGNIWGYDGSGVQHRFLRDDDATGYAKLNEDNEFTKSQAYSLGEHGTFDIYSGLGDASAFNIGELSSALYSQGVDNGGNNIRSGVELYANSASYFGVDDFTNGTQRKLIYSSNGKNYFLDNKNNFGLEYQADYSVNGKLNDRWIPDWGSVKSLGAGYQPLENQRLSTTNSPSFQQINVTKTPTTPAAGINIGAGGTTNTVLTWVNSNGRKTRLESPYPDTLRQYRLPYKITSVTPSVLVDSATLSTTYPKFSNYATASQVIQTDTVNIIAIGNSFTQGGQGGATPYATVARRNNGKYIYNRGVSGETTAQISARMALTSGDYGKSWIFEAGYNDLSDTTLTRTNLLAMKNRLSHTRYLFLGIVKSINDTVGTANYTKINQLNSWMSYTFSGHFIDENAYLLAKTQFTDPTYYAKGVPGISIRASADILHLNNLGVGYYTEPIIAAYNVLLNGVPNSIITTDNNFTMFGSPPTLGGVRPNFVYSTNTDVTGMYTSNGVQAVYVPNQTIFTGSTVYGTGGVALSHTTGSDGYYNTFVGFASGLRNTTGNSNVAIGQSALQQNTTGSNNIGIGAFVMPSATTPAANIGIGTSALNAGTTLFNDIAIGNNNSTSTTDGYQNTSIGVDGLRSNTTGHDNIAIGYRSGYNTGVVLSTTSNNVFIGSGANSTANAVSNSIALGSGAQVSLSNQVVVGNSSVAEFSLPGAAKLKFGATVSTANQVYGVNVGGTSSEAKTITGTGNITITNSVGGISINDNPTNLTDNILSKTASYTIVAGDFATGKKTTLDLYVDATAGAVIITLPSASTFAGYTIYVTKTDAGVNTVTINGDLLTTQNQTRQYNSNGTAWRNH